jgi:hypothetical protein
MTTSDVSKSATLSNYSHIKDTLTMLGITIQDSAMSIKCQDPKDQMELELIQNPDRLQDPMAWMELQSNLHDSYSMESERLMFAAIMGGSSIEEAITIYHANTPEEAEETEETEADDIEMF